MIISDISSISQKKFHKAIWLQLYIVSPHVFSQADYLPFSNNLVGYYWSEKNKFQFGMFLHAHTRLGHKTVILVATSQVKIAQALIQ